MLGHMKHWSMHILGVESLRLLLRWLWCQEDRTSSCAFGNLCAAALIESFMFSRIVCCAKAKTCTLVWYCNRNMQFSQHGSWLTHIQGFLWLFWQCICSTLRTKVFQHWDSTKTRNGSGNGSKNGSIICSTSGRGKSFRGHGLTSALVTRTSMQASPPVPPCATYWALWVNKPDTRQSFPGLCPDLPWQSGNEVRPSQDRQSSDTKYCTVHNHMIARTGKNRTCIDWT